MSDISSTNNFWIVCGLIGIGISIMCLMIAQERMKDRREAYSMEQCHEVPGHDYAGCLHRESLEWNRGGNDRVL